MAVTLQPTGPASPRPLSVTRGRIVSGRVWPGLLIVVAITAVLWSYRFPGPIDLRYDAGVYYVLGTSLAEGKGYRLTNEPGSPQSIQYPPGLPALIALHERLLATSNAEVVGVWLKHTFAAIHLLLAIATFFLVRALLGEKAGLIATLLGLIQLNGYLLSNLLFTELPFTLVSVCLALLLLNPNRVRDEISRSQSSNDGRSPSRPFTVAREESPKWIPVIVRESVGFLLVTMGFALRAAGLALMAAWVGEAVFRRKWRTAAMRLVLALVPFGCWQGYIRSVRASDEYHHLAYAYQRAPYQFYNVSYAENLALVDPFQPELGHGTVKTLIARVAANVVKLPISIGEAASEVRGFWSGAVKAVFFPGTKRVGWLDALATIPVIPVSVVVLVGGIQLVRWRAWFPVLLIVFSVGLTFITPWPAQVPRYLSPVGPFLAIALVVGATATLRWLRGLSSRPLRRIGLGVASLWVAGFASAHAFAALNSYHSMTRTPPAAVLDGWVGRRWFYYDPAWANWDRAIDWIGRNAPPDAVVATSVPHLCYLMTGRHAVLPPMEANPSTASELLREVPVAYVVIDELDFLDISRRYAAPAMTASSDWRLVERFNKTLIYGRTTKSGSHDEAAEGSDRPAR